ncbi:cullin family protein [Cooperia oncophora]
MVIKVLENVLIKEHMYTIVSMENSGVHAMLGNDEFEQLASLYGLLQRVENGLSVMADAMSGYLRQTGTATVREDCERTPVVFIEDLLELKERFDEFLLMSFQRDKMFKNRIQTEFETFINLNKNSPEYLSLYMDEKLRKGLKSENDENAEKLLDKAMVLFRFLQEKDVFEKYYKQHMARRLLLDKSISDDMERMMISKLKAECGCHFTLKLENMFRDKELWTTQLNAFKEFRESVSFLFLYSLFGSPFI